MGEEACSQRPKVDQSGESAKRDQKCSKRAQKCQKLSKTGQRLLEVPKGGQKK